MSPRPILDLTRRAWAHQRGDITVIGTWWTPEQDNDIEPALVLMPSYRRMPEGTLPPTVLLSGAYLWDAPAYAVQKSEEYLRLLGMDVSAANVMRLVEIITDHLRDLFRLPPLPDAGTVVVADATIVGADGRSIHAEITRQA